MKALTYKALTLFTLTLLLSLGFATDASACVRCVIVVIDDQPDNPGDQLTSTSEATDIWIIIWNLLPVGDNQVLITIPGYETVGAHEGVMEACATAQNVVPGIATVDAVSLHASRNGEMIYEFQPQQDLNNEFRDLASSQGYDYRSWTSFFTDEIPLSLPDGIPVHFNMLVTLEEGTSLVDLARSLEANGVFATSAANANHSLNADHFTVFGDGIANVLLQGN